MKDALCAVGIVRQNQPIGLAGGRSGWRNQIGRAAPGGTGMSTGPHLEIARRQVRAWSASSGPRYGQGHHKPLANHPDVFDLDAAAVRFDDLVADREAQVDRDAGLLEAEAGIEDLA